MDLKVDQFLVQSGAACFGEKTPSNVTAVPRRKPANRF